VLRIRVPLTISHDSPCRSSIFEGHTIIASRFNMNNGNQGKIIVVMTAKTSKVSLDQRVNREQPSTIG